MENLNKRPSKGILRFSEGSSRSNSVEKDIKWDEANIKETLHPDDKEYGFMRIDEPPTPFSRSPHGHSGENSDEEEDLQEKTDELLERVSRKIKEPPVTIENVEGLLDDEESDGLLLEQEEGTNINGANPLTPSASTSSKSSESDFETKRKRHYNEFYAVKLAKKLMQKELDDDEDEDEDDDDDDEEGNDNGENYTSRGRKRGENAADRGERKDDSRGGQGGSGSSSGNKHDDAGAQDDDTFDKDKMIS